MCYISTNISKLPSKSMVPVYVPTWLCLEAKSLTFLASNCKCGQQATHITGLRERYHMVFGKQPKDIQRPLLCLLPTFTSPHTPGPTCSIRNLTKAKMTRAWAVYQEYVLLSLKEPECLAGGPPTLTW